MTSQKLPFFRIFATKECFELEKYVKKMSLKKEQHLLLSKTILFLILFLFAPEEKKFQNFSFSCNFSGMDTVNVKNFSGFIFSLNLVENCHTYIYLFTYLFIVYLPIYSLFIYPIAMMIKKNYYVSN